MKLCFINIYSSSKVLCFQAMDLKKVVKKPGGTFFIGDHDVFKTLQLDPLRIGLLENNIVLVLEDNLFKLLLGYPCDFIDIPDTVYTFQTGIAWPKGSHFREPFDYLLNQLKEMGIMHHLRTKYIGHVSNVQCSFESENQPLGYDGTFFAFLVVMIGCILGGIICGFEWYCNSEVFKVKFLTTNSVDPSGR